MIHPGPNINGMPDEWVIETPWGERITFFAGRESQLAVISDTPKLLHLREEDIDEWIQVLKMVRISMHRQA